ncbi:MAG: hypothetical protein ACT4PK_07700 [Gammaproteobacteria bacterium]
MGAKIGWGLALVFGVAAVGVYLYYSTHEAKALAEQAAAYEAQMAQVKADAAAQVKLAQDTAAAEKLSLQTELDFHKMPELPIKTLFRAGQVLYVENQVNEPFSCKVRLARAGSTTSTELDFFMKAQTFQDIAAIQDWMFAKGDKIEFIKPGFKPRALMVP